MPPKAPRAKKTYYEQFVREFKSSEPKPVYIISGVEEFLKIRAQKLLLSKLVDPSTRDFNYDCFSASEAKAGEVIAACNTIPFGPGRRVVRLTDAQRTSPTFRKQLTAFIASAPINMTLIMNFGEIKSVSQFHNAVAQYGVFLDCRPPFPNKIPDYVKSFFMEFGLKPSPNTIRALIDTVGTDLYSLHNEIQKLSAVAEDGENLTPELIHQFASAGLGAFFQDYLDALGRKNLAGAVKLANGPLLQTDSALTIIFRVAQMFNTIYAALDLPGGQSLETFLQRRVSYSKIGDYCAYVDNFRKPDVERVFSLLFFAEWEAKLNPTPGQQLLQVLSYYICNPSLYNGKNPFPALTRCN